MQEVRQQYREVLALVAQLRALVGSLETHREELCEAINRSHR